MAARRAFERPATRHRHGLAGLNVAVLSGHETRGEDISEERDLFVRKLLGNFECPEVGERHPGILGLPAGVAAVKVRVAEQTGSGMSVKFLHLLRAPGTGGVAQRGFHALAEVQVPQEIWNGMTTRSPLLRRLSFPASSTTPINS
jgi:hypothetical protein